MKTALLSVLAGFAALCLGAPSQEDPKTLWQRAIGDSCRAPEGSGTCQKTSSCKGISYPTGLCPRDPKDVQCCVEIACKADNGSGFCRSVKNNGCDGGTFVSGKCPGPNDIKCCIKNTATKCSVNGVAGTCLSVSKQGCPDGKFTPGFCPGPRDIQCCTKDKTPPPPPPPSWPECRRTLSCTFAQIERTSMQERLDYVRYMQSVHFGPLRCGNQFRAIEGVIRFFIDVGIGAPGSWVSYVDAGIVEGIQRGGAIALGMSTNEGGNPGSAKWADFMRKMRAGALNNRDAHDKAWSDSEEAATEYGRSEGDASASPPTNQTLRWFKFTQLFRAIMRNRAAFRAAFLLAAPLPIKVPLTLAIDAFLNWLTDITNDAPTFCGSKAAWELVDFDSIVLGFTGWTGATVLLGKLLAKFWICYLRE